MLTHVSQKCNMRQLVVKGLSTLSREHRCGGLASKCVCRHINAKRWLALPRKHRSSGRRRPQWAPRTTVHTSARESVLTTYLHSANATTKRIHQPSLFFSPSTILLGNGVHPCELPQATGAHEKLRHTDPEGKGTTTGWVTNVQKQLTLTAALYIMIYFAFIIMNCLQLYWQTL